MKKIDLTHKLLGIAVSIISIGVFLFTFVFEAEEDGKTNSEKQITREENKVVFSPKHPVWLGQTLFQTDQWKAKFRIDCLDKGKYCGEVEFRSLSCFGRLRYVGEKYNKLIFEETIELGNCKQNCEIHLQHDASAYQEYCEGKFEGGGSLVY
ncbi:MAG: hypothetical protein MI743_20450 [Sneathiellales bacterium]|nr:hypothetical protein [Sneathiellales bacterium]